MQKLIILISFCIIAISYFYYLELPKPTTTIDQRQIFPKLADSSEVVFKKGKFIKIDDAHFASGNAIIKTAEGGSEVLLSLEDFSSAKGPDLFVYLSKESNLNNIKSDPGEFVSLGPLKSMEGEQTYNLPDDYNEYKSVLIWCRAFSVLFSSADLN